MLGEVDYMIPELDPNFLGGLGASLAELRKLGRDLAVQANPITAIALHDALLPFSPEERDLVLQAFVESGGDALIIPDARQLLALNEKISNGRSRRPSKIRIAWAVLGTASMAASAFHGYRRNQSVPWALAWGALGLLFPIITPTVAIAQGFGRPK